MNDVPATKLLGCGCRYSVLTRKLLSQCDTHEVLRRVRAAMDELTSGKLDLTDSRDFQRGVSYAVTHIDKAWRNADG